MFKCLNEVLFKIKTQYMNMNRWLLLWGSILIEYFDGSSEATEKDLEHYLLFVFRISRCV